MPFVVDKQTVTESVWRTWKPDPNGPKVNTKIRPLTKEKYREFNTQAKDLAMENGIPITAAMDQLIYEHVFANWEKGQIVNKAGENLPCIPENIRVVCELLPGYAQWAVITADTLAAELAAAAGRKLKNSEALQDG